MATLLATSSVILLLALFVVQLCCDLLTVQFERVEQLVGGDTMNAKKLRIRKYNRTVSVLNGTLEILRDLNDDFSFTIDLAYSPLGNKQFINSPFHIPRQEACQFFNTTYRNYRESYRNMTNFPDAGVCPIPAMQYYIDNMELTADLVNDYAKSGLWKITFEMFEKDISSPIFVGELLCKISRDTML
ncbi:uncharacterized protein LOC128721788 [Anopheles nili]|uniref:uncharacterized protein LOC128721788 n=1 Tax=Anopheles nili TaxID=185578 RepID=UPI00237B0E1F|nr:uncharacterized protein LOC128721788 [Anopheles nili]